MDARERLRRYLEQRRELGETELVLDGLAVDDVMAMLGARAIAKPPRGARAPVSSVTPPGAPAPPTTPAPTLAPERLPVTALPAPETRFDTTASGNWRHALRPDDPALGQGTPSKVTSSAAASRVAVLPAWLSALGIPVGLSAIRDHAITSRRDDSDVANAATDLDGLADLVRHCTRCTLHVNARNAVPGEGHPHAEFLCVGEAPGANEDEQGKPFVGEAGQLLTKILSAIDLSRESVYICNVLKHRPPANRDPLPEEVAACQPYLQRQVELVNPRVILALGRFAAQTLLGTATSLGKLRGQVHEYRGIPVIVTYHPAALLRNEAWKRPTWDDVKLARTILDASRAAVARDGGDQSGNRH